MTTGNPASVLERLLEQGGVLSRQFIDMSPERSAIERLIAIKALVQAGSARSILCLACDEPHSVAVEQGDRPGRFRAYCPDTGFHPVEPAMVRTYRVDLSWLVNTVRHHFGLSQVEVRSEEEPIIRIGRVRVGRYPVLLFLGTRLAERSRFTDAMKRVEEVKGDTPAIVLTSTDPEVMPGDLPARTAPIRIADVLDVDRLDPVVEDPMIAALRGPGRRAKVGPIGYVFASDFRSATIGDVQYAFTDRKARVVEVLFEAWQAGNPKVHQKTLQAQAGFSSRVGQIFAGHAAYETLIRHDTAGYYWLDL
ncbi:MAG: hypothetical protein RLO50_14855 [Azospirillaceae bacterium]